MCGKNSSSAELSGFIIAVSVCTILAAATLIVHNEVEKKRIGGRIIKVNYKFAKEFDN